MPTFVSLLLTMLMGPGVPPPVLHDVYPAVASVETPLTRSVHGVPMIEARLRNRRLRLVVDTGATGTTLATDVAIALGLTPQPGLRIDTLAGRRAVSRVRVVGLQVAGMAVEPVDAAVHDLDAVRRYAPDADGILGQDILGAQDYLLDLRGGRLRVGNFEPPERGVALPLDWSAGRPVLHVGSRVSTLGLVLDSGSDVLIMEAEAARLAVGTPPATREQTTIDTHVGRRAVAVERHPTLRLGGLDLSDVALIRMEGAAWPLSPEAGLLPASLFSRVYVSARRGRAVVWRK